ncbi:HyaD/HybD family hydrogenase maturation endopeptidase [Salidesulfovibrio onnuriiensis]|uniref:HyaD/HybD family hydrogenase maturation endopeptidase n=1 Tax=Salidesulfovibrio onnuriiensis TaxID=2583823 RepID=UPI0011C98B4E|nr:HyaD/HybD family hydrogenase maturation endopeptidase [Salidesulfovibrio onnuriiensis]
MQNTEKRILVLGVGNILYTDEGFGVRVVEALDQKYEFSGNVELMDGGTLGTKLMGPIMESDALVIVDIVLNHGQPGDIHRLKGGDLSKSLAFKNSMHQTDLLDVLANCKLVGQCPDAEQVVLVGVEPQDYDTMSTGLSKALEARIGDVMLVVLKEIEGMGGSYRERSADNPSGEKIYVPRSTD